MSDRIAVNNALTRLQTFFAQNITALQTTLTQSTPGLHSDTRDSTSSTQPHAVASHSDLSDSPSFHWTGLSVRTRNALSRAGIRSMEALASLCEEDILKIRNLGITSLDEIRQSLGTLQKDIPPKPFTSDSIFHLTVSDDIANTLWQLGFKTNSQLTYPSVTDLFNLVDLPSESLDQLENALGLLGLTLTQVRLALDDLRLVLSFDSISEIGLNIEGLSTVGIVRLLIANITTLEQLTRFTARQLLTKVELRQREINAIDRHLLIRGLALLEDPSDAIIPIDGIQIEDIFAYLCARRDKDIDSSALNRNASITKIRLVDEKTLEETGILYNLTRERVRQIVSKIWKLIPNRVELLRHKGLVQRFTWIESCAKEQLTSTSAPMPITEIENRLDWEYGTLRQWVRLNALLGVLNPAQQSSTVTRFGNITFCGDYVINNSLRIQHSTGSPNQPGLQETISQFIGTSKLVNLKDLSTVIFDDVSDRSGNTSAIIGAGLIVEALDIGSPLEPSASSERPQTGWAVVSMGRPCYEITRAILHYSAETTCSYSQQLAMISRGIRSDLLAIWIKENSTYEASVRNIEIILRRHTDVFIQKSPSSWGLKNLSTTSEEINSAAQVIPTQINLVMQDGKLTNLGGNIKFSHQQERKGRTKTNKSLVQIIIDRLHSHPDGLDELSLIHEVREIEPDANGESIHIYLRYVLSELITSDAENRYKLNQDRLDLFNNNYGLSTIDVLIQVLSDANDYLPIPEILSRCDYIQPVQHRAVRGYLAQNYSDLFEVDEDKGYRLRTEFLNDPEDTQASDEIISCFFNGLSDVTRIGE